MNVISAVYAIVMIISILNLLIISFIRVTFRVLLSDINIAHNNKNEKLIVLIVDINFLNI